MQTQAFREAQKRYRESEKGKASLKRYQQTDKFKEVIKRYRTSDKAKANRKSKPDIYMKGFKRMFTTNVCNILTEHAEKTNGDPERLSTEFICRMSRILVDENKQRDIYTNTPYT